MIVQLDNIVKRYNDLVALDHFSMNVQEGEIYGLLGPNGSGKTTAINCMLALLRYDEGSVHIFGEKMHPTNYNVKKRIGLVMQNIGVYDELSVVENLDYFCGLYISDKQTRKQYVDEAIEFVGLEDFRKFRPKKLSGGLLRRLNLACGIVHKPDLIVLDEPTVAVDPQSRNRILDGIKDLAAQGKTIIYTTHYMEEVEYLCDRLTILDRGKEIVTGTSSQIKEMSSHGEVVTLEVAHLTEATQVKIKAIPQVSQFIYEPGNAVVHFEKGQSHLTKLLTVLDEEAVNIINLSVQKPTLNDVFLEITGKELRDNV
ncbi:ABC transporter ATP-binding protein [Fundicoccus culcitae]|uniref:ABC transporter ATP-binding protein n=1 Tax=Fundicoccus culcitae TaxID=2969821 RepID=A0ABY5P2B7_9LACT|nr:ABC transporter ATP-binding protein [Fundicoccus culcitae]UUX32755.1 ABC transporter ATP-binding protein [Fundicoccus culcitae]